MSGGKVVAQFKEKTGLHSSGIITCKAQVNGKAIHSAEGCFQPFLGQQIRIVIKHIHSRFSVELVGLYRQLRAEMMQGKELQQAAHTHLQPELFADLLGPLIGNTGDLRKPFRLPFHHPEGIVAEMLDDPGGDPGADAFDHPAGQIGQDLAGALGHHPLQKFRLKLLAVAGVGGPFAGDHESFAQAGQRNGAHHRGGMSAVQGKAQHAVAVVIVLVDNGGNGTL